MDDDTADVTKAADYLGMKRTSVSMQFKNIT